MTSYSDNAYDVTNFLLFWKDLGQYSISTNFIVVRHQMVQLNWGGGGGGELQSVHYRGILDPVRNRVKCK